MANATDSYRADVTAAYQRLVGAHGTVPDFLHAHREFHLALLSACSNRQLYRTVVQLHDHTQRFQVAGSGPQRRGDAGAEHAALFEAVVAGDVRTATSVLTAHLRDTLRAVQAWAASRPTWRPHSPSLVLPFPHCVWIL